jgi:hypothetical protein
VGCASGKHISAFDLGAPIAAQSDAYIQVDGAKRIRGTRKVALPYFQVEFAQQSSASAFAMSMDKGGSSKKTTVTLTGVDPRQFQSIADDFYDAVVADLKAAGIEVVPLEELQATPEFKKLSGHGFESAPYRVEHFSNVSQFYAPHGMKVYFIAGDPRLTGESTGKKSKGSLIGGLSVAISGVTSVYSGGQYSYPDEEKALSAALGAQVLRVRVVVDFADVSAAGDNFGGGKTSTSTSVKISFAPVDSFYHFVGPDGDAVFALKEQLISGDGFAEKIRTSFLSSDWEAAANAQVYESTVRKHLEAFRKMAMARIQSSL